MGPCSGKLSNETYKHVVGQRGWIIITPTDIIISDSKKEWQLPVKFLRRYGYEGNMFYFELCDKCISGGGLYSFMSDEAKLMFDMIAKNWSHGHHEQTHDQTPAAINFCTLFPSKRYLKDDRTPSPAAGSMNWT